MTATRIRHRSKIGLAALVLACAVSVGTGDVALAGRSTSSAVGAIGTNKNIDRSLAEDIGTRKGIDRAHLTASR